MVYLSIMKMIARPVLALAIVLFCSQCSNDGKRWGARPFAVELEATGYCKCGDCCGWKRNAFMQPVFAYGPNKGKKKEVGVTASGTKARLGTIAADTSVYPFGTKIFVPGYGWGVVEDRGGAIKGQRIDLFFNSHRDALQWGRKRVVVEVVYPH